MGVKRRAGVFGQGTDAIPVIPHRGTAARRGGPPIHSSPWQGCKFDKRVFLRLFLDETGKVRIAQGQQMDRLLKLRIDNHGLALAKCMGVEKLHGWIPFVPTLTHQCIFRKITV